MHRATDEVNRGTGMEYSAFSLCEGVSGRSHVQVLQHLLEQVEIADRGDLDMWFFAEHHANPSYSLTPSPNLLIAAASQRTNTIRLGNMVNVLPYHHPLRAAEEIRVLDALTGGRLEVGVGRGGIPCEQAAFGLEGSDNGERFTIALELLFRFLTETKVDYDTKYWAGTGAVTVPEPTQRPHPPLWLACVSDQSFATAARLGINCATSLSYPALLADQLRQYRAAWEEAGHEGEGRFGLLAYTVVAESTAEAIRFGKEFVQRKVDGFLHAFSKNGPTTDHKSASWSRRRLFEHISRLTFNELVDENLIVFGTVDECVEQLQSLKSAGVDMFSAWIQFAELDFAFAKRSLRLFCEEVVPTVEAKRGAM